MNFVPNTDMQKKEMLKVIGVADTKALFADIPEKLHLNSLNIPKGMSEIELRRHMEKLAAKNKPMLSFQGAGAYNHFIPAVVDKITSRSEFYTAYTPYQPEISQGILQAIFEYQTMICELTGMDVANASMYDGASAMGETAVICKIKTKRNEIIISRTVHQEYIDTVKTYAKANEMKVIEVGFEKGLTDMEELQKHLSENTAGVLVQSPNFFGMIEPLEKIGKLTHDKGAVFVVGVVEATSLGLFKSPGELGADIVVGEGQSYGNGVNFGGPYLGIMAVKNEFMRNIPGRLVGETVDEKGRKGYVLTLQAREQHIRREKATSNICSNEALCALAATVYLSMMGKKLKDLALMNYHKAHYAYSELKKAGHNVLGDGFYNEFVVEVDEMAFERALGENIVPGIKLSGLYPDKNHLLICVTEMMTKEDIDRLVEVLR
ncbi:MAG: aminomethyl-transferring glycine dehydrogenase subunit GcvPA [archaeon]